MKKFKQIFYAIIFVILLSFTAYGCKKDKVDLDVALNQASQVLPQKVVGNLDFKDKIEIKGKEVEVKWESNNTAIIANNGTVTLPVNETIVSIKITVTYKEESKNKTYQVTVISKNSKVRVTFDTNGGDAIDAIDLEKGKTISTLPTPTKANHTFVEWQLKGAKFDVTKPITESITLTAVWKLNSGAIEYEIKYENVQGYYNENPKTFLSTDSEIILKDLVVKGNDKFLGWYTTGSFEPSSKILKITELNKDYTLYAKVELRLKLTINLSKLSIPSPQNIPNYNSTEEKIEMEVPSGYVIDLATLKIDNLEDTCLTKSGDYFEIEYWNVGSASNYYHKSHINGYVVSESTTISLNLIVFRKVTFNTNGSTLVIPDKKVKNGTKVRVPSERPNKEGFVFKFWSESGESVPYDFNSYVWDNLELVANYKAVKCNLTYPGLLTITDDSGAVVSTGTQVAYNQLLKLLINTSLLPANHEVFKITCNDEDIEESLLTKLKNGQTVEINAKKDLKFKVFSKSNNADEFKVSYFHNQKLLYVKTVAKGDKAEDINPQLNDIKGYNFQEWCEDNACTTPFDFTNKVINEDTKLYAKLTALVYNITFDSSIPSVPYTHSNPTTYTVEDEVILEDLTVEGYEFLGWWTNPIQMLGEKVEKIEVGSTGNKAFYPAFKPIVLNINFDVSPVYIEMFKDLEIKYNDLVTNYNYMKRNDDLHLSSTSKTYLTKNMTEYHINSNKYSDMEIFEIVKWYYMEGGNKVYVDLSTHKFTKDRTLIPEIERRYALFLVISSSLYSGADYQTVVLEENQKYDNSIDPNPSSLDPSAYTIKLKYYRTNDEFNLSVAPNKCAILGLFYLLKDVEISYDMSLANETINSYKTKPDTFLNLPSMIPTSKEEGHVFSHWVDQDGNILGAGFPIKKAMVIKPVFNLVKYQIIKENVKIFDASNSEITLGELEHGTTIIIRPTLQPSQVLSGLIVNGEDLMSQMNGNDLEVTVVKDLDIKAIISNSTNIVSVYVNDVLNTTIDKSLSTFDLSTISVKGYEITGWYKEKTFNNQITDLTITLADFSKVYAKANLKNYTINYHLLDGETSDNIIEYNIKTPNIILNGAIRENYIFNGWYDNPQYDGNKIVKINTQNCQNIDLYPKFEFQVCTLKINFDDFDIETITQEFPKNFGLSKEMLELNISQDQINYFVSQYSNFKNKLLVTKGFDLYAVLSGRLLGDFYEIVNYYYYDKDNQKQFVDLDNFKISENIEIFPEVEKRIVYLLMGDLQPIYVLVGEENDLESKLYEENRRDLEAILDIFETPIYENKGWSEDFSNPIHEYNFDGNLQLNKVLSICKVAREFKLKIGENIEILNSKNEKLEDNAIVTLKDILTVNFNSGAGEIINFTVNGISFFDLISGGTLNFGESEFEELDNASEPFNFKDVLDFKVYIKENPAQFTAQFMVKDSVFDVLYVNPNTKIDISKVEIPELVYEEFTGWTISGGYNPFDFDNTPITEDIIFSALLETKKLEVTFDLLDYQQAKPNLKTEVEIGYTFEDIDRMFLNSILYGEGKDYINFGYLTKGIQSGQSLTEYVKDDSIDFKAYSVVGWYFEENGKQIEINERFAFTKNIVVKPIVREVKLIIGYFESGNVSYFGLLEGVTFNATLFFDSIGGGNYWALPERLDRNYIFSVNPTGNFLLVIA